MRNVLANHELWQMPVRRSAGFTLLEVMVSIVILTVAATIFLAAIAQNVRLEAMNAETNVALHAAAGIVEDVHTMTYAEVAVGAVPATFVAEGETKDGRTLRLTNSAGSLQVGNVQITENGLHTKKAVEARVTWRSATGEDRSVLLMTEVTNY